jgi:biopolymer transport protein ExbB
MASILMAQTEVAPFNLPQVSESTLDLKKVFNGSPLIYTILLILSIISFVLWLYTALSLRLSELAPSNLTNQLEEQLKDQRFEAAIKTCQSSKSALALIMLSALNMRKQGVQLINEAIQAEGRRLGITLWQRLSLLNDIITIAPMLGLLGTVIGMFYAFYDVNRSMESIIAIFDGLGIAIGTTVAGLIVAITAMIFHTHLKQKVSKVLNFVEAQATFLGALLISATETDSK